jgi:hypothetical protein
VPGTGYADKLYLVRVSLSIGPDAASAKPGLLALDYLDIEMIWSHYKLVGWGKKLTVGEPGRCQTGECGRTNQHIHNNHLQLDCL